jgi:hypothetical protein
LVRYQDSWRVHQIYFSKVRDNHSPFSKGNIKVADDKNKRTTEASKHSVKYVLVVIADTNKKCNEILQGEGKKTTRSQRHQLGLIRNDCPRLAGDTSSVLTIQYTYVYSLKREQIFVFPRITPWNISKTLGLPACTLLSADVL